jgi:pSer/pThr/pTyr-binding forkhead associated (FHA) protein
MVVTVSGLEVEEYLSHTTRLEDEALLEALVIPLEKTDVNSPEHMLFVGRSSNNDIVLDNERVSKLHAYFCQIPGSEKFQLVDMNSTNGTFLNGQKLAPSVKQNLEDADVVSFGPETRLEFFSSTGFCQLLEQLIE